MPIFKERPPEPEPRPILPGTWECKHCGQATAEHCTKYMQCRWRVCICGWWLRFRWVPETADWSPEYVAMRVRR